MHSADIVHRDLKPANLLLNANCDLKVRLELRRSSKEVNSSDENLLSSFSLSCVILVSRGPQFRHQMQMMEVLL